jgi:hypothetical protein
MGIVPCKDVTELIRVIIGPDDRLKDYQLRKITCGVSIGSTSRLLGRLHTYTISEILKLGCDSIRYQYAGQSEIEDFLNLKHLFALQMVLETFTGRNGNSVCKIIEISYGDDGIIIAAEIEVNIITDKIKSCGPCEYQRKPS